MKPDTLSSSIGLRGALFGMVPVLLACVPALATSPPSNTSCKVWNVQFGPIVMAIPYTPNAMDAPLVHLENKTTATSWIRDHVPCDAAPARLNLIGFSTPYRLVPRGEMPQLIQVSYPAHSPEDISLLINAYRIDPARVKTRCRDGFDTGLGEGPYSDRAFACLKDSGRVLVWECVFPHGRKDGACYVFGNIGPVTVSYRWDRKFVSHEQAPRLDEAVIDFLNSMIVSGEKLPK